MHFAKLLSEEFQSAAIPLTAAAAQQMADIEDRLSGFRHRLDAQISALHHARCSARAQYKWSNTRYQPSQRPDAQCRFEQVDADGGIRYSGTVWYADDQDSFSASDSAPLPEELLRADEEVYSQYFADEAARLFAEEQERLAAEKRGQAEAQDRAEREQYETLKKKFG